MLSADRNVRSEPVNSLYQEQSTSLPGGISLSHISPKSWKSKAEGREKSDFENFQQSRNMKVRNVNLFESILTFAAFLL